MSANFTISNSSDKQEFDAIVGVAGLLAYNMKQTNNKLEMPAPEIIKVVRNEEGIIIGGVSGSIYLSGIEIDTLWVDERYRGQQIASWLLDEIEADAIEAGCTLAYLSTYSFQAPTFYEKCGYTLCGEIDGFVDKISLYSFRKDLSSSNSVGYDET